MGEMISWVPGAVIGTLLALANFCASIAITSVATRSSKIISIVVIVGTFFMRLTLLFLAFYFLSRVAIIDLSSALVTFTVCFTVLIFWEMRMFYRKARFSGEMTPPGFRVR
jgi:hypothetical protein